MTESQTAATPRVHFSKMFFRDGATVIGSVGIGATLEELRALEGAPILEGRTDLAFMTYDRFLEADKDARFEVTYFHDEEVVRRIQLTFGYDSGLCANITFGEFEEVLRQLDELLLRRYGPPITDKTLKIPRHGTDRIRSWSHAPSNVEVHATLAVNPKHPQDQLLQVIVASPPV